MLIKILSLILLIKIPCFEFIANDILRIDFNNSISNDSGFRKVGDPELDLSSYSQEEYLNFISKILDFNLLSEGKLVPLHQNDSIRHSNVLENIVNDHSKPKQNQQVQYHLNRRLLANEDYYYKADEGKVFAEQTVESPSTEKKFLKTEDEDDDEDFYDDSDVDYGEPGERFPEEEEKVNYDDSVIENESPNKDDDEKDDDNDKEEKEEAEESIDLSTSNLPKPSNRLYVCSIVVLTLSIIGAHGL
ncbi:hypothetical protein TKK_0003836 [Trichogramma kaykai]